MTKDGHVLYCWHMKNKLSTNFNNSDFDKDFDKLEKSMFSAIKVFMCAWVIWVGLILIGIGAAGYMAWHFISKLW